METFLFSILVAVIFLAIVAFKSAPEGHKKPKLPKIKNGDWIKITYLPPCKNGLGTPNPYIGMEGEIWDFDGTTFSLQCETNWLAAIDLKGCKYEIILEGK